MIKRGIHWVISLVLFSLNSVGQSTGNVTHHYWKGDSVIPARSFPLKHFIIPAALMTYGLIALNNDAFRDLDENTQEEICDDPPHNHSAWIIISSSYLPQWSMA